MSADSVDFIILCEDRQQEVFIRRFLQKRRPEWRAFRPVISPAGRGSGEQWVRAQFPSELKSLRSRAFRRNVLLVVAIDADTRSVEDRIRDFSRSCEDKNVPFRSGSDKVMFVIPKRNIETWFAYLQGRSVNETDSYPRHECENDCRNEASRLDEMCRRRNLEPEPPPPSLMTACAEFQRIAQ